MEKLSKITVNSVNLPNTSNIKPKEESKKENNKNNDKKIKYALAGLALAGLAAVGIGSAIKGKTIHVDETLKEKFSLKDFKLTLNGTDKPFTGKITVGGGDNIKTLFYKKGRLQKFIQSGKEGYTKDYIYKNGKAVKILTDGKVVQIKVYDKNGKLISYKKNGKTVQMADFTKNIISDPGTGQAIISQAQKIAHDKITIDDSVIAGTDKKDIRKDIQNANRPL